MLTWRPVETHSSNFPTQARFRPRARLAETSSTVSGPFSTEFTLKRRTPAARKCIFTRCRVLSTTSLRFISGANAAISFNKSSSSPFPSFWFNFCCVSRVVYCSMCLDICFTSGCSRKFWLKFRAAIPSASAVTRL